MWTEVKVHLTISAQNIHRVKNRSYLLKTVFMIIYLITDNSRKIRMQGYWISPDKRPVKEKPERKEKLLWIL